MAGVVNRRGRDTCSSQLRRDGPSVVVHAFRNAVTHQRHRPAARGRGARGYEDLDDQGHETLRYRLAVARRVGRDSVWTRGPVFGREEAAERDLCDGAWRQRKPIDTHFIVGEDRLRSCARTGLSVPSDRRGRFDAEQGGHRTTVGLAGLHRIDADSEIDGAGRGLPDLSLDFLQVRRHRLRGKEARRGHVLAMDSRATKCFTQRAVVASISLGGSCCGVRRPERCRFDPCSAAVSHIVGNDQQVVSMLP